MKKCIESIFKIIILLSLALVSISNLSCNKYPKTIIYQTDTYYSYTNINYGEHERHYLDLVIPKRDKIPSGIILYIHGGGWTTGDKKAFSDSLKSTAEKGYIASSINYRYANGNTITYENILDDIDAALTKVKFILQEKGILVDKVMLTGLSAGAHLSLMYAYTRVNTAPIKPVAVASYAGPTNLYDNNFYITSHVEDIKKLIFSISGANIIKGSLTDSKDALLAASPINYVNENTVPTLICHGTKDDVVPYSNANKLYDLLTLYNVETELITFHNSGHGLENDSDSIDYTIQYFYELAEKYL